MRGIFSKNKHQNKKYLERRVLSLCVDCGDKKPKKDSVRCKECLLIKNMSQNKRYYNRVKLYQKVCFRCFRGEDFCECVTKLFNYHDNV